MVLEICLLVTLAPPKPETMAVYLERSKTERVREIAKAEQALEAIETKIIGGSVITFRTVEDSDRYLAPLKAALPKAHSRLKWLKDKSKPYYAKMDLTQPASALGRIDGKLTAVEVVNRQFVIARYVVSETAESGDAIEHDLLVGLPLRTFGLKRGETFFAGEIVWHFDRAEATKRGTIYHFEPVPQSLLKAAIDEAK